MMYVPLASRQSPAKDAGMNGAKEINSAPAIRNLYFHIPFCAKLCPYCSFYVDTHFKNKSQRFLDALLHEVEMQTARFKLRPLTVYFGGGTPSSLSLSQLEYLLTGLRERIDLADLTEWTFEINPATVSKEKADLLRAMGVNRISMGVQSWDEPVLKTLGRIHTGAQAEQTHSILRRAGFDNVSLDLMFGVPGQSREQWRDTLRKTIGLQPEHISAYCLTYEEDTEFFRKLQAGTMTQDMDWDADLFEMTMDELCGAGYVQYEVSNYSRPGHESQHNSACWRGDDYLGFGPGAFSTRGNARWQNIPDSAAYAARVLSGDCPESFREELSPQTRQGEQIAFSLRTQRGVDFATLKPWHGQVNEFLALNLLQSEDGRITLTRKGKLLADSVAEIFV